MKILLTAFDPFGGETVNPAQEAVWRVPDRIGAAEVVRCLVPTVFRDSVAAVEEALEREKPDLVICVGQAAGREGITMERVAINVDDARIPDNRGDQPVDCPVVPGGPAAYFSTLPVKAMAAAVRREGLPASVSNTAGTFVCNHLMYGVLHRLAVDGGRVRGGFVHVPALPVQAEGRQIPSMALEDIVRGLTAAVSAAAEYREDIRQAGGREW